MKLLKHNIGGEAFQGSMGNDFLNKTPKAQETKAKLDKGDDIKLRSKRNNQQTEETATKE